jgi:hypothetical protein
MKSEAFDDFEEKALYEKNKNVLTKKYASNSPLNEEEILFLEKYANYMNKHFYIGENKRLNEFRLQEKEFKSFAENLIQNIRALLESKER